MARAVIRACYAPTDEYDGDDKEDDALLHREGDSTASGEYVVSDDENSQEELGICTRIADSSKFQAFVMLMIILNAFQLAVQVDHKVVKLNVGGLFNFRLWLVLNASFSLFFMSEIVIRICGDGCSKYFCDKQERGWNIFDLGIVFVGAIGMWYDKAMRWSGHPLSNIMILRVLRILCIVRLVRVIRYVKKLQMLARGLVESMQAVFWIFLFSTLCMFISAILCTTIIGQEDNFSEEDRAEIQMYWGSVGRSMFTLLQFVTMDDWAAVSALVIHYQPFMLVPFYLLIFFGAFVLLSLLTGVMADHINDVRRQADLEERREKVLQHELSIKVTKEVDINGDESLDRDEFQKLMSHRSVKKTLSAAGVSLTHHEAKDLFEWFDTDGDGLVGHDELYHGLKHLFEGVTGLQMYKLKVSIRNATATAEKRGVSSIAKHPTLSQQPTYTSKLQLAELSNNLDRLETRMETFETQVRRFMSTMGWSAADSGRSPTAGSAPSPQE